MRNPKTPGTKIAVSYSVTIPPKGRGGPIHIAGGLLSRKGVWRCYAYDPDTDESFSFDAASLGGAKGLTREALGWDPFNCDWATVEYEFGSGSHVCG